MQTTFDLSLTREIDGLAKNALAEMAWRNVSDYGILLIERNEGNSRPQLRVMIG